MQVLISSLFLCILY